jgi:hypothetical protein
MVALPMLKLPSNQELLSLPKRNVLNYSSPSFSEYFSLMGILANKQA